MNTKTKTIIIKKINIEIVNISIKTIDFPQLKLSNSLRSIFQHSIITIRNDNEVQVCVLSCVVHLLKDKHLEQLKELIEDFYDEKIKIDVSIKQ